MITLIPVVIFSLLVVLGCIVLLTAGIFFARNDPVLRAAVSFRHLYWKWLFISLGAVVAGLLGVAGCLLSDSLHLFPTDGELTVADGTALFFILPFIGLSLVSCCLSACWCLGRLLAAILSFCRRPD